MFILIVIRFFDFQFTIVNDWAFNSIYLSEIGFKKKTFNPLTTNEKTTANRIFDLKYRVYGQKKFSGIYMNSTSVNGYSTNKSLI